MNYMKKFNSTSYYKEKYYWKNHELYRKENPDGYLFTVKGYRTKIKPEDLPEWYVYGYFHKCWCYVSAKGVKDIKYFPSYNHHIHKDDCVVVSYNGKIITDKYASDCRNYDEFIGYESEYIDAVEKYSGLDLSEIKREAKKKEEWFYEKYPDRYK